MISPDQIDKTIHERGRLAIMTLLASRPAWAFQDLKADLKMSDGNLITHLRTLHKAGYVAVTKEIKHRPQTTYALTEAGRAQFQKYLEVLEQIVATGRQPAARATDATLAPVG
ncbi:MAG: transcriptional regulator [Verrucomicrobiota bacterium]